MRWVVWVPQIALVASARRAFSARDWPCAGAQFVGSKKKGAAAGTARDADIRKVNRAASGSGTMGLGRRCAAGAASPPRAGLATAPPILVSGPPFWSVILHPAATLARPPLLGRNYSLAPPRIATLRHLTLWRCAVCGGALRCAAVRPPRSARRLCLCLCLCLCLLSSVLSPCIRERAGLARH